MITIKKKTTKHRRTSNPASKATALKVLKYGLITLMSLVVAGFLIGGSIFAFYVSSTPKLTAAKLSSTNSSLIYDTNGTLIADLGSEKRESVSANSIPLNLVNAVTSIEDKRFFKHRVQHLTNS